MIDQASELRKLVLRAMRERPVITGPPPRVIAVTGGKPGVGVTTIAVNLSVALAEQGSRVVIIDADMDRWDVAALCGLNHFRDEPRRVGVRYDIHEVMHPGPAGIQIVPGLCVPNSNEPSRSELGAGEISCERLQRQVATLGRHADVVIMDLGNGGGELPRRFSVTADVLLLVTTPDNDALMEAYARIKTDLGAASDASLRLVVNRITDESQAVDVHSRIDSACRRFLNVAIEFTGQVPHDDAARRAAASRLPFVLGEPAAPASRAIDTLASRLVAAPTQARSA